MINKKTVFVLGAGSSAHLGFPTGTDLKDRVSSIPKDRNQYAPFYSYLNYKDISTEDSDRFFSDLKYSGKSSVDAFLEHQSEFYAAVGKAAIATILIPFENKDKLFDKSSRWYGILFKQMSATFEEFSNNQLSIITYNYDRSIEYYLVESLMHSYQRSRQEVASAMKHIPIIHLHGDLGRPKYFTYLGENNSACRSYDGTLDMPAIELASSRIKIIHESIENEPQFAAAMKLIKDADIVAFLGFGYDETNLKRLDISSISFRKGYLEKVGYFYGTSYGKHSAEAEWIKSYIHGITLGGSAEKIEDFILDQPILIQPKPLTELLHPSFKPKK